MLIWSSNFLFQFFGSLFCFLCEIFPPLSLSALPLTCSFLVSWMKYLLNPWECCLFCLFVLPCFLSCVCTFCLFWSLMFETFWERSLALLCILKTFKADQKGGRPFWTVDCSLHRWWGRDAPVSLESSRCQDPWALCLGHSVPLEGSPPGSQNSGCSTLCADFH